MTAQLELTTPAAAHLAAALAELEALNALTGHASSCAVCGVKPCRELPLAPRMPAGQTTGWWDHGDCETFAALLEAESAAVARLREVEAGQ